MSEHLVTPAAKKCRGVNNAIAAAAAAALLIINKLYADLT
jgi:hypothetical protein